MDLYAEHSGVTLVVYTMIVFCLPEYHIAGKQHQEMEWETGTSVEIGRPAWLM